MALVRTLARALIPRSTRSKGDVLVDHMFETERFKLGEQCGAENKILLVHPVECGIDRHGPLTNLYPDPCEPRRRFPEIETSTRSLARLCREQVYVLDALSAAASDFVPLY
jgi:hypothetical protein